MNITRRFNPGNTTIRFAGIVLLSLLAMASAALAQLPVPSSSQFDISGFIETATLGGAGSGAGAHQGGFLTVNGQLITVPSETIVILPASALTWAELFTLAPAPYGPTQTGLALNDLPAPMTTYEAHIIGNRVLGGTGGADVHIAGLIYISQHALNSGQGIINFINYATGEIRVGGLIGNGATGTRVQLNDPAAGLTGSGRYGRAVTPDPRFTANQNSPTVRSISGFPMCIPRTDPASPVPDALCPQSNRPIIAPGPPPVYSTLFTMNNPVTAPGVPPDATIQAPFEVGDRITYAGTLVHDGASPTAGPWPGSASAYVSAHTIVNNTAIYTVAGTSPAYAAMDVAFIGTGGLALVGAGEPALMTRFEGFSTDTSRLIHLYGLDLNPVNGVTSDRDWGTIGVDPSTTTGRWRFRPPCGLTTPDPTNFKDCTGPLSGTFLPPTREVRAVVEGAWTPAGPQTTYANGIIAGQYHTPIADYRFPDATPGKPASENNFSSIPFLASGGFTSSAGTLAGVLNPFPGQLVVCLPPPGGFANAGGPYTVASGQSITLNGSAGGLPASFLWTPPPLGTIYPLDSATPVYTAGTVLVDTLVPLMLTAVVTDFCGGTFSSSSSTTVLVHAMVPLTVNPVAPISVFSGGNGAMSLSATDPNVPPALPLVFTATQAGSPALINFTVTQGPNPPGTGATITFIAPTLPAGQVTSSAVSVTITARNFAGAVSSPGVTSVTVVPLPDVIAIQSAQYRVNLQRLTISATSSVVSPNVVLKLQPYVTTTGTTYNPDPAAGGVGNVFTNTGGGVYTLTLSGVPEPACGNPAGNNTPCPTRPLDVKSNLNGDSGFFALTRIQ